MSNRLSRWSIGPRIFVSATAYAVLGGAATYLWPRRCSIPWRWPTVLAMFGVRAPAFLGLIVMMTGWPPFSPGQEGAVQRVHDPHIIREGDSYYIFSTGIGIPIRRSQDLFRWQVIGRVFDEMPPWAREAVPAARSIWAPDISYFNGEFHLLLLDLHMGKQSFVALATTRSFKTGNRIGWFTTTTMSEREAFLPCKFVRWSGPKRGGLVRATHVS